MATPALREWLEIRSGGRCYCKLRALTAFLSVVLVLRAFMVKPCGCWGLKSVLMIVLGVWKGLDLMSVNLGRLWP